MQDLAKRTHNVADKKRGDLGSLKNKHKTTQHTIKEEGSRDGKKREAVQRSTGRGLGQTTLGYPRSQYLREYSHLALRFGDIYSQEPQEHYNTPFPACQTLAAAFQAIPPPKY